MNKRILLIDPFGGSARMPGLATALSNAGAEVLEMDFTKGYDAVLDALEDGFMPVVLKEMQRD